METLINKVGTFEVESGKLVVSDPCYHYRDTRLADGLQSVLENVRNGTWEVNAAVGISGYVRGRVTSIKCFLRGTGAGILNPARAEKFNPDLGVDSGQMSIVDSTSYPSFVGRDHGEYGDEDSWYYQACLKTQGTRSGVIQGGAVCSSGWGDGGYPGYLYRDSEGKVVGVEVVFITEEEDYEN